MKTPSSLPSARRGCNPQAAKWHALANLLANRFIYERSLKLTPGAALSDRFLLSLPRSALRSCVGKSVERLVDELAVPDHFQPSIAANCHDASCVHFGFEGVEGQQFFKLYLEFTEPVPRFQRLVHLAFKWDPSDPHRSTISRYSRRTVGSLDQLRDAIATYYDGCRGVEPERFVLEALGLAVRQVALQDIDFLDVHEDSSARRSFDLCLYDADLRLREVGIHMSQIGIYFRLQSKSFDDLWRSIEDERLGHIAGGTGRDGREFLTLYFGARVISGVMP